MPKLQPTVVALHVRHMLHHGGSLEHAHGVRWFFKDEIKSHGWYTDDLRRAAMQAQRQLRRESDLKFLLEVADHLFSGRVLEEKVFAILMLEKLTAEFGDAEFHRFESWLKRISSWADHDALLHYLIGPMIVSDPERLTRVFRWAKSRDRWHRRAACVALIRGTRQKLFFPEIVRLSNFLLSDKDDMVQKGLGWLLRETVKADPKRTIPYLMRIRKGAPRFVLRTACETLPKPTRKRILAT